MSCACWENVCGALIPPREQPQVGVTLVSRWSRDPLSLLTLPHAPDPSGLGQLRTLVGCQAAKPARGSASLFLGRARGQRKQGRRARAGCPGPRSKPRAPQRAELGGQETLRGCSGPQEMPLIFYLVCPSIALLGQRPSPSHQETVILQKLLCLSGPRRPPRGLQEQATPQPGRERIRSYLLYILHRVITQQLPPQIFIQRTLNFSMASPSSFPSLEPSPQSWPTGTGEQSKAFGSKFPQHDLSARGEHGCHEFIIQTLPRCAVPCGHCGKGILPLKA